MKSIQETTARLATLDELKKTLIPAFFAPMPEDQVLRTWFKAAKIPYFKANPAAKRGGGPVYFSVAAIEKFLRGRVIGNN